MKSAVRRSIERFFARPPRAAALVAVLVVLAALSAVALRLMDRRWWCRCGRPLPWIADVHSEHNSQHLLDPYSASHVLHGILFYALLRYALPTVATRWRLAIAATIEVAWELAENTPFVIARYRDQTAALGYEGDSIANSLGDLACALVGFALAQRLPWPASLAIVVAAEVAGLALIRDNLTLNVIMLLHPIDAVREWQSHANP